MGQGKKLTKLFFGSLWHLKTLAKIERLKIVGIGVGNVRKGREEREAGKRR